MADSCGIFLLGFMFFVAFSVTGVNGVKFDEVIHASWASDHMIYDGELLKLKLDNFSGAGFASKNKYLYGKATAEIKLVKGDSAGTVTAFYVKLPVFQLLLKESRKRTSSPFLSQQYNLRFHVSLLSQKYCDLYFPIKPSSSVFP